MPKLLRLTWVPALLLAATACTKGADAPAPPPPPPPISAVLPHIPVPPQGVTLSQASGADATQLTIVTPLKPDSIVNFYRRVLGEPPFRLVSEMKEQDVTIFMAEQDGPSLWVTVKSDGASGTAVTIAGGATLPKADSNHKGGATKPGG